MKAPAHAAVHGKPPGFFLTCSRDMNRGLLGRTAGFQPAAARAGDDA